MRQYADDALISFYKQIKSPSGYFSSRCSCRCLINPATRKQTTSTSRTMRSRNVAENQSALLLDDVSLGSSRTHLGSIIPSARTRRKTVVQKHAVSVYVSPGTDETKQTPHESE